MHGYQATKRDRGAIQDAGFRVLTEGRCKVLVLQNAAGSIDTWAKLHKAFLNAYFPAKRANVLKKGIINFEQGDAESLYDYVERFKRLVASCPYHGLSETGLVMQLYNGMLDSEKKLLDIGCGGSITNLTANDAMKLIAGCAEGSRSFGKTYTMKNVSATSSGSSDTVLAEIAELKHLVKNYAAEQSGQKARACGICGDLSHPTDCCPQLQDNNNVEDVNAIGGYNRPRFDNRNGNSGNYNPRYNDHPGFRWRDNQGAQNNQGGYQAPAPNNGPSTQEMLDQLTKHFASHSQKTDESIGRIERQVSQLASQVGALAQATSNALPSQTIPNPRANVSAIFIGSNSATEEEEEEDESSAENASGDIALERPQPRASVILTESQIDGVPEIEGKFSELTLERHQRARA